MPREPREPRVGLHGPMGPYGPMGPMDPWALWTLGPLDLGAQGTQGGPRGPMGPMVKVKGMAKIRTPPAKNCKKSMCSNCFDFWDPAPVLEVPDMALLIPEVWDFCSPF